VFWGAFAFLHPSNRYAKKAYYLNQFPDWGYFYSSFHKSTIGSITELLKVMGSQSLTKPFLWKVDPVFKISFWMSSCGEDVFSKVCFFTQLAYDDSLSSPAVAKRGICCMNSCCRFQQCNSAFYCKEFVLIKNLPRQVSDCNSKKSYYWTVAVFDQIDESTDSTFRNQSNLKKQNQAAAHSWKLIVNFQFWKKALLALRVSRLERELNPWDSKSLQHSSQQ